MLNITLTAVAGNNKNFITINDDGTVLLANSIPAGTYTVSPQIVTISPPTVLVPITDIVLNNSGTNKPWTVGHAFKKGEVANGSYIVATGPSNFQADIRNRWDDGSVKFAVLSGIGGANVQIRSTTTKPVEKANVAEPVSINYSLTLTGAGAGVYAIPCGAYMTIWNKNGTGLVRSILGPVMSEFHYYRPTNDPHIALWFYVRVYATGDIEVETVVENGWLNVAAPGHKTYDVTVTVGGVVKYTAAGLVHRHHTRWSRIDWVGNDPGIVPQHNVAYLRSTKLIPNYGYGNSGTATLDALVQTINPNPMVDLGNYPAGYGSGGDKPTIGLLPHWTSLWCAATKYADVRAYKSLVSNAQVSQRYAFYYRDETTGRPPKMATNTAYANIGLAAPRTMDITGQDDVGNSISYIPATPSTDTFPGNQIADRDHAAQDTYVPYLATGRWSFVDHAQMKQMSVQLLAGSTARNYNKCWFDKQEIRGRGWLLRDCSLALAMTPDNDTFRAELQQVWSNNMEWLKTVYANPADTVNYEPAGWLGHMSATGASAYNSGNAGPFLSPNGTHWWDAPWMHWFNVLALANAKDLELPVNTTTASNLDTVLAHNSKIVSGILGSGDAGTFSYRRAGQYALPVGTTGAKLPLDVKFTWDQVYTTMVTELSLPALPAGNTLLAVGNTNAEMSPGYFDCSSSNFGYLVAAAALMAPYSAECKAAYNRVASSTTFAVNSLAWHNAPKSGIIPRV